MIVTNRAEHCRVLERKMNMPLAAVLFGLASLTLSAQPIPPTHADDFSGKPRVVVISDVGNEPDDQMSFVRLLMYSNEFDIEAMVATTSTWQRVKTHPETMRELIDAYGEVRPKLLLHAKGWPEALDLGGKVLAGQSAYGMAATGSENLPTARRPLNRLSSAKIHAHFGSAFGAERTRWHRRSSI